MVHRRRIAPVIVNPRRNPVSRRMALDNLMEPLLQQRPHLRLERPDRRTEHRLLRDDIARRPGMNLRHRNHRLIQGMDIARNDRLDRPHHPHHRHDRIDTFMRRRPMPALARHSDIGRIDRGHQRPRPRQEMPERHVGRVMDAVNLRDAKAVHHPVGNHRLAPCPILLRRLKDQRHPPGKAPRLRQILRGPQQHRHMPVMPAGVHLARHGRGIGCPGHLQDRQRVHIGPEAYRRPRPRPVDQGDNSRLANPAMHLVHANLGQPFGDIVRGRKAIERQFRMRMQMLPPALHFLGISGDTVQNGHRVLLDDPQIKPENHGIFNGHRPRHPDP